MPNVKQIIVISIVSAATVFAAPFGRGQEVVLDMCSAEIAGVITSALQHALSDAKDLPDFGVVTRRQGPIYVLNYLREQQCLLNDAVLPTSTEEIHILVSRDDLLRMTPQGGDSVAYVSVGEVRLSAVEARLRLGVSIQQVPGAEQALCCCSGELVLGRVADRWEFVEWTGRRCI